MELPRDDDWASGSPQASTRIPTSAEADDYIAMIDGGAWGGGQHKISSIYPGNSEYDSRESSRSQSPCRSRYIPFRRVLQAFGWQGHRYSEEKIGEQYLSTAFENTLHLRKNSSDQVEDYEFQESSHPARWQPGFMGSLFPMDEDTDCEWHITGNSSVKSDTDDGVQEEDKIKMVERFDVHKDTKNEISHDPKDNIKDSVDGIEDIFADNTSPRTPIQGNPNLSVNQHSQIASQSPMWGTSQCASASGESSSTGSTQSISLFTDRIQSSNNGASFSKQAKQGTDSPEDTSVVVGNENKAKRSDVKFGVVCFWRALGRSCRGRVNDWANTQRLFSDHVFPQDQKKSNNHIIGAQCQVCKRPFRDKEILDSHIARTKELSRWCDSISDEELEYIPLSVDGITLEVREEIYNHWKTLRKGDLPLLFAEDELIKDWVAGHVRVFCQRNRTVLEADVEREIWRWTTAFRTIFREDPLPISPFAVDYGTRSSRIENLFLEDVVRKIQAGKIEPLNGDTLDELAASVLSALQVVDPSLPRKRRKAPAEDQASHEPIAPLSSSLISTGSELGQSDLIMAPAVREDLLDASGSLSTPPTQMSTSTESFAMVFAETRRPTSLHDLDDLHRASSLPSIQLNEEIPETSGELIDEQGVNPKDIFLDEPDFSSSS